MAGNNDLTTRLAIVVTAAGAGALGVVAKDAIDFEAAMADVAKVVDGTDEQLASLAKRIKELSTELPIAADGLAKMAAAGGQLGIPIEKLEQFIQLSAEMSTAFGIDADAAGAAVAKLSNVFNLPLEGVRDLGDAINVLGNTTAAAEKDIINVMTRIGGTAKQFGLTGKQAAALASTMLSLGVSSQVAGTGINAMLAKLQTAGDQSKEFRQALEDIGLSASQLADSIRENPQAALTEFLDTLEKLDASDRASVLTRMFGTEYQDDIARLLNGLKQYKESLDRVSDSSKTAGAMSAEFKKRLETTQAQIDILQNSVKNLSITLGDALLPAIKASAESMSDMTAALATFAEEHPHITATAVQITTLISTVGALRLALTAMGITGTLSFAGIIAKVKALGAALIVPISRISKLNVAVLATATAIASVQFAKHLREEYEDVQLAGDWLALQFSKLKEKAVGVFKSIAAETPQELRKVTEATKKAVDEIEEQYIDLSVMQAQTARALREVRKAAEDALKSTPEAMRDAELAAENLGGALARLQTDLSALSSKDLGAEMAKRIGNRFKESRIAAERYASEMNRILVEGFERAGANGAQALGVISEEAQEALDSVNMIAEGLLHVQISAHDAGIALAAAIDGALEKADSERALGALAERIEEWGRAGRLSAEQVTAAFGKIYDKIDDLKVGINSVEEALRALGVTSDHELKRMATSAREAFNAVVSGNASLRERQAAFRAYADAAIAANNGVADEALKVEAAYQGMSISADEAGNVIVQSMGEAVRALREQNEAAADARGAIEGMGDGADDAAAEVEGATQSIERSVRKGGEIPWLDAEKAMSRYASEAGAVAQKVQQDVWSAYYKSMGGRDGKEIAVEVTRYQEMFYDALDKGRKAAARYVDQMEALDERQRQVMSGADSGVSDLRLRLLEIEGTEEEVAKARLARDKEERNVQIQLLEIEAARAALQGDTAAAAAARDKIASLRQELALLDRIYEAEQRRAREEREKQAREEAEKRLQEERDARSRGENVNDVNIYIEGILDVNDPVTLDMLGRKMLPVLGDLGRRGAGK
ncbi:MAG: phage tail tape measure protein [Azoarcus sp.]|jgi:TP901 family phage tail tape measure protein|nr:phage tail tape measure protein [Azoarcus sp.]